MRSTPLIVAAIVATLTASAIAEGGPSPLRGQIAGGQRVKVEGQSRAGVFHAQLVALRDTANTVKVEGPIDAVSDGGRRLQVLDFVIAVDASTRLYRGNQPAASRSTLVRGAWIEAKGTWQRGLLKATRIRLKSAPEPTEEIEGIVQSVDPGTSTLLILDRRIVLQPDTTIVDERTGASAPADRLRRDDDDAAGRPPIAFGNVVFGGRAEAGFLDAENFDVGERLAERTLHSRVQALASAQVTDTIEAYTKVTLARSAVGGGPSYGDARLSEGYVLVHRLAGAPVDVQIGRQRFRDSREWFFDDYLDAARLHVTLPAVRLEAAVSRGILSDGQRRRRDELQFIASAVASVSGVQLRAYTLARRDTTRNERPVWIGGMVSGRAASGWSYWGDVATRRGTAGSSRLAGWAVDGGVKRAWTSRWSPTLTLGYAVGSGDRTDGDGLDTRFRQTDLEDNQAYFGGLRRVAIYGELFDPELTNLHVLTAGVGLRPKRGLGIDAIYHRYQQVSATSALPSGQIDGVLNGVRRALGDELDFVLTLRVVPGIDLDVSAGVFLPGPAFVGVTAPAFFWRPQLRFFF